MRASHLTVVGIHAQRNEEPYFLNLHLKLELQENILNMLQNAMILVGAGL